MSVISFMYPFSIQPPTGILVKVFLKDGSERVARTCQVDNISTGFSALQWYDRNTRKAINVNFIKGWVYLPT
jgi:hypothetical protein